MPFGRYGLWTWVLLAALNAVGCAGDGKGLDQNGQPIGLSSSSSGAGSSSSGGSSTVTADFQSIQDNVFTPICSKCHIGASAPEGLQLDAAHSYNLLVGVPSVEEPGLDRVKPSDPDHSYMVLKIEGAAGIDGGQMPLGETPLPQATIDAIRQWITNGAMNSSTQTAALAREITRAAGSAFAVESTDPANLAVVAAPVRRIAVAFTHEADASLVNQTTVSLERMSEGESPETSPTAIGTALAVHNPAVLLVTPLHALVAGTYRLRLRGTGAAALADVNANVLGADQSVTFVVEAAP
jgi:hypothetical protein